MKYGTPRARFNWWVVNILGRLHWPLRDLTDFVDRLHCRCAVHLWDHMTDLPTFGETEDIVGQTETSPDRKETP